MAYPTLTNGQQLVGGRYYVLNPSRGDITDGPFTTQDLAQTAINTGLTPGGIPGPAIAGTCILFVPGDPTATLVAYNVGKIWDQVIANINGATFTRTQG